MSLSPIAPSPWVAAREDYTTEKLSCLPSPPSSAAHLLFLPCTRCDDYREVKRFRSKCYYEAQCFAGQLAVALLGVARAVVMKVRG